MSDRVFIGTRKGLFILERSGKWNGGGWHIARTAFLGDPVTMVLHDPRDGALYAALHHGHFGDKLHRSDDGGANWEEIAVPEYPSLPEGEQIEKHPFSGKEIPWKLDMIWELQTGGADEPGTLWCGTLPGGLFRSNDRGNSWKMMDDLWFRDERKQWFGGGFDAAGIHSVIVDPRNSKHITVGISCGGSWQSEDGGATWKIRSKGMFAAYMPPEQAYDENSQDPHIVVACPASPDHLWTQHHNGIFRTVDGGANWTHVDRAAVSDFGFACAGHPREPDTAWFVPAIKDEKRIPVDGKLVVTRTRDGGHSFDELRDGLPQEHAYDIVFRHALAIDETGDTLVFGTTTGSVFATQNQGDSWACVSNHLPPVYVVRFG